MSVTTAPKSSWHALPAEAVVDELGTDPAMGLSKGEAADRLARYGPNELRAAPPTPIARRVAEQLRDPLAILLIVASAVSFAVWLLEDAAGFPFETVVIGVIVVLNAGLGVVQELRAESAVAALEAMTTTQATVRRGGHVRRVPSREVVVGDVVVLEEGDAVIADARVLESTELTAVEAALTGESEPSFKRVEPVDPEAPLGDRHDLVFSGTAISRGRGVAVVVATGMDTEVGRIADLLSHTPDTETPLQTEMRRVSRALGVAVVVIALIVIVTILLFEDVGSASALVEVLLLGVSLAVAAVPEGLATVLTLVLALGVQRMARRNALVKRLSAVETLGSASVVCSDKTGTLTRNEMTVRRVVTSGAAVELTGSGYAPEGEVVIPADGLEDRHRREVEQVLAAGALVTNAALSERDGHWEVTGDPTEAALLAAADKVGVRTLGERFTRLGEVPFSSERKLMTTVHEDEERADEVAVISKGAPDVLLARCSHEAVDEELVALDDDRRREIHVAIDGLAADALRTLGIAAKFLPARAYQGPDTDLEHDLVWLGVVGIIDPPREEAAAAVARARDAGVRTVMITGDHPVTALAIAEELGIAGGDGAAPARVVSGPELEQLDDQTLFERARDVAVFARVSPEHKLRIVTALQRDGQIVAMTGDGVNDAPALKTADIGVAMGRGGTDVAREAGDMILTDDDYATIIAAIEEGRAIYANIRTFVRYLLSSNVGEVLTMLFGVVLAGVLGLVPGPGETLVLPLLATQILWINLVTDVAPALAVGLDPPPADVMRNLPRPRSARVIDRQMWVDIGVVGVVMAVSTLLTLDAGLPGGLVEGSRGLVEARTMAFTVLVLAQLFNVLNSRSATRSAFSGMFVNPWLWAALALSLLLQVLVVQVPLLNDAFTTVPLDFEAWAWSFAAASAVLWVEEIRKWMRLLTGRRLRAAGSPA